MNKWCIVSPEGQQRFSGFKCPSISDEPRCKNPKQNTSKLNLTVIRKIIYPDQGEIYLWDARYTN